MTRPRLTISSKEMVLNVIESRSPIRSSVLVGSAIPPKSVRWVVAQKR